VQLTSKARPAPVDSGPAARIRPRLVTALLVAPLLIFVAAWPLLAPTDPDYWWHARTGQLIVDTGRVPTTDPYSFTAAGQPWVAHEWLAEVLFYAVQHQFGYVGNVVLIALVGSLAAVLLFATCRLRGVGELASVVVVLWAFGMSLGSYGVRPQTFTRVLLTLVTLLVTLYRLRRDWRWLLPLPPLFLLWVNLHGGFAIGIGLLGLTLLGEAIEAWRRERTWHELWPLAIAVAACVLATLLNPNGLFGSIYPLAYLPEAIGGLHFIAEWQPPDPRQLGFASFWLSLLLALGLGLARRPLGIVELLWGLAFSVLAIQAVRSIQVYAAVVLPLLGARLACEVPAFGRTVSEWRNPRRLVTLWTLVSVLCAGLFLARFTQLGDWPVQLGDKPDARAFPIAGATYLRDHPLPGNLFNQFEWGGYLIYANFPAQRVFIDGRPDMYGNSLFNEYVTVANVQPGWRTVLDAHAITLILVDRDGPLAAALLADPAWQNVFVGPVERLFQRSAPVASTNSTL
jgi:hypothetical protein